MARKLRIHYEGALYHVMARGNNGEYILGKDKDKESYIEIIKRYKKKYDFKLYAYCIMDNHVHLLIQVNKTPLSKIMQGIQQVYTQKYNKKNNRTGHVFQQRYKAILCNMDGYLIYLTKYIHMNPVKAGIIEGVNYKWSSYREYIKGSNAFIDVDFVLKMILSNKTKAIKEYAKFMDEELEDIDICEYKISESPVADIENKINNNIEEIINEVIKEEKITKQELISKARTRQISSARKKIVIRAGKECDIRSIDLAKRLNITITAISKIRSRVN